MSKDFNIRLAKPPDRDAIQEIADNAYAIYLPRMDRKPFPMLDDYAAHIAAGRVYILENAGGIVAYMVLIEEDGRIWLDTIGIMPDSQGKGYGRALVNQAENLARQKGYKRINLYTNEAMRENLTLYPHLGYKETHRAVQNGYHRVFFEKNL